MIEINNLTKKFKGFPAVDNMSLKIERGSFVGFLGPNGAGKTTTIKIITGLLKPTSGEVFINGSRMHRNNKEAKRIMGIVPQHSNLDKELTVYENLVFAAKLFNVKDYGGKIRELLELVELSSYKDKKAMHLSGGMARRLIIAKALINDPEIIILDEPTVGIDLNGRRKIWDILKYMKKTGRTVLMTTHYIEEVEYLCDSVFLIDKGRVFENDTSENLRNKLGNYTVEYYDEEMTTKYEFFHEKEKALEFTKNISTLNYTVRQTTLEDVFYNFTAGR